MQTRLLLEEIYLAKFKIHDNRKDGYKPNSYFFEEENVVDNSILSERITLYVNEELHKHTGLNFMQLMELPRHVLEMLIDKVRSKQKSDNELQQAAYNNITNQKTRKQ